MSETQKNEFYEAINQLTQHKEVKKLKHNYHKGRPFLCIVGHMQPAPGVATTVKGWSKNEENWSIDERHSIADHISNKALVESTVIIDILNAKIVKNRHATNSADDDLMIEYYLTKYKETVKHGIQVWLDKKGIDKKAMLIESDASDIDLGTAAPPVGDTLGNTGPDDRVIPE